MGRATTVVVEMGPDGSRREHHESPFTDHDRWLALALEHFESDRCSGCGHPRSQAWHPDAEGEYTAQIFECHACKALHDAASGKDQPPHFHYASNLDPSIAERVADFPI